MPAIPKDWKETPNGLTRTFEWKYFLESLAFVIEVAEIAQEMNHHPDVDIRWNKVLLTLMTHSQGKITDMDYQLAEKINGISADAVEQTKLTLEPATATRAKDLEG
jgi:4a-hydroxytetrahydrobiopterin dehydratase